MNYTKLVKQSIILSITMFIICGLIYPLALTGIAQVLFPSQANGSLVYVDGKAVGSSLIGQDFTDERLMKTRPSAVNYNTYTQQDKDSGDYSGPSTGSNNYAPSNPDLAQRVQEDVDSFLAANPTVKKGEIPADLLTASGSGLDPHLSPQSARLQIPALVKTTGLTEEQLIKIVQDNTTDKVFGVLGGETVNVLGVNIQILKTMKQ